MLEMELFCFYNLGVFGGITYFFRASQTNVKCGVGCRRIVVILMIKLKYLTVFAWLLLKKKHSAPAKFLLENTRVMCRSIDADRNPISSVSGRALSSTSDGMTNADYLLY